MEEEEADMSKLQDTTIAPTLYSLTGNNHSSFSLQYC